MQNDTYLIAFVTLLCALVSAFTSSLVAKMTISNQKKINEKKDVVRLVYIILSSSEAYWLSPGPNKTSEFKLKNKLFRLTTEISNIYSKKHSIKSSFDKKIIKFRRKITGGTFESANRVEEPGRVSEIQEIGYELIDMIKTN